MTIAVVIQARVGSERFPGKILQDIADRPALTHVIKRCQRIPGVDEVIVAVPDQSESKPILEIARKEGARTFRGSEKDVLGRTLGAARAVNADHVVRITSDCPLIDPDVCLKIIAAATIDGIDYSSNVISRTFPQGLDCEAFPISSLIAADNDANARYDREHVTSWMRRPTSGLRLYNYGGTDPALSEKRWTLDWPEDLEFFRAIFEHGEPQTMADVFAILLKHPEIEQINAMRNQ